MKVGSLCECVVADYESMPLLPDYLRVKKGQRLTVRNFDTNHDGTPLVRFDEIIAPYNSVGTEMAYELVDFREILPPEEIAEALEEVKEHLEQLELV